MPPWRSRSPIAGTCWRRARSRSRGPRPSCRTTPMSVERIWASSAVEGLLLLAALLIFPNLDDRYLGDDEAETALLARSVLRFGVPVAWDAASLISQECGGDHDANYIWRQTPHLHRTPSVRAPGSPRGSENPALREGARVRSARSSVGSSRISEASRASASWDS